MTKTNFRTFLLLTFLGGALLQNFFMVPTSLATTKKKSSGKPQKRGARPVINRAEGTKAINRSAKPATHSLNAKAMQEVQNVVAKNVAQHIPKLEKSIVALRKKNQQANEWPNQGQNEKKLTI